MLQAPWQRQLLVGAKMYDLTGDGTPSVKKASCLATNYPRTLGHLPHTQNVRYPSLRRIRSSQKHNPYYRLLLGSPLFVVDLERGYSSDK